MSFTQEQRYYLKLKALYYLYENGYTQTEIAKRLNISRVTLGKLLDEARKEGMIKFEIVDIHGAMETLQLEEQLRSQFDLQDVKLVDCSNITGEENINRRIAYEGALYFDQIIKSGMKIGITWGRTLNLMMDQLTANKAVTDIEVYTLLGGASQNSTFQPNIIAQKLINKYNGRTNIINAPFMCRTDELCAAIKNEPAIASVLEASHDLDVTLVGIGKGPEYGVEKLADYPFSKDVIKELNDVKAVGDICGNFFDINGKICRTSLNNRIISINISDLLNHKKVIGVGGGKEKTGSITGALNGHYLHVLITDTDTARQILANS